MSNTPPAPRNRSIRLDSGEIAVSRDRLSSLDKPSSIEEVVGRTICQDLFDAIPHLPDSFVDLLIADPPYNLDKSFHGNRFRASSSDDYEAWIESWLLPLRRVLKPTASLYICGDWRSSTAIHRVAEKHFEVQNRITWEREKGRGATANWKNCSEDIWFLTMSRSFTFNVDAVKLRRRVIAPYREPNGKPKDWLDGDDGKFRLTHPSNLWTDVSVPFWSMPENTDHPTQKPEKLIAKLVLASSNPGDVVFDPFLGSGTSSVVAKKLSRRFVGIEQNEYYCCLAEKRLAMAGKDGSIQGYEDGVFWERNAAALHAKKKSRIPDHARALFPDEDAAAS